ncbi:MAG TPA: hypothetical protein VNZ22_20825 [Bacillota bacterium]|nr:hypothetical protein [Bacillota bacterium]
MKLKSVLQSALSVGITVLLVGCSEHTPPPAPGAPAEKPEESRVKHGTNGAVVITLEPATQKVMGLQTTALAPARLSPELKAYGRVLEISPLAALVAELTTSQAASEATQAELKRLKTLAAQNNASERALQAAEAAAVRDQAQVESVRLRLLVNWGHAIAEQKDLPAFVQSLGTLASALIELNVPAGQPVSSPPTGARVMTLASENPPIPAQFLSPAPVVDPQLQGRGFLFLVSPNPSRLTPGATLDGFLSLPGEPQAGVMLPREAVIQFNGASWVYLQTGEETFERVEASLDRPLENGWFVSEGLKPQDKVVTVGAQQLLSEELKGQSGE